MNNINQLVNMFKFAQNPQQMVLNMLSNNRNNPMVGNVMTMVQNNDAKGLEQFARNLAKEKNFDIESALKQIQQIKR